MVFFDSPRQTPFPMLRAHRKTLAIFLLAVSCTAGWGLSRHLAGQLFWAEAEASVEAGHLGLAIDRYKRAMRFLDQDSEVPKALGETYGLMGRAQDHPAQRYLWAKKEKEQYVEAFRRNPLDSDSAFRAASAAARLESLLDFADGHTGPAGRYDAGQWFRRALSLRPNGFVYQYGYLRYLSEARRPGELRGFVEALCRHYPPAYNRLRKESYWEGAVRLAAERGLRAAISDGRDVASAHLALAELAEVEGRWQDAAEHCEAFMASTLHRADSRMYLRVGGLYLKLGDEPKAARHFMDGLVESDAMQAVLDDIFNLYAKAGASQAFIRFFRHAQRRVSLPPSGDILLTRAYLQADRFEAARENLEKRIARQPTAEFWYWMARIAEAEKDEDRMELAIQRATALDPENEIYRKVFLNLLKKKGKFETAEAELDRAIAASSRPSARLYVERAELRWRREDFSGAANDWYAAARLAPKKANLWANAGEAAIRAGSFQKAEKYYRRAANLAPHDSRYKNRLAGISGKGR